MIDINAAQLAAMKKSFITAFNKGMESNPHTDLSFLFTDFPSTTASNFYPFLHKVPGFREWVGDRVLNAVQSGKFEILNRVFESTHGISREDIEDDQYGLYAPLIRGDGESWPTLLNDLVLEVLTGNPTCATGKPFVDSGHKYGKRNLNNKTTTALSSASFDAAITATSKWKYSSGELIKPRWTHMIYGPKLRDAVHLTVGANLIPDGNGATISNKNYNRVKHVEVPELAGDYENYWFMVDGTRPIHAIARQIRRKPVPVVTDSVKDLEQTGRFEFMASGRAASGPTLPHLIYGGIVAAG